MGDERIHALGGAWQHAIDNVIAGSGVARRADPDVDRRRHWRVHGLEGASGLSLSNAPQPDFRLAARAKSVGLSQPSLDPDCAQR